MVNLMLIIIKRYIAAHYFSFQNRYHQVEPFTPLWGNCYKFPLRRGAGRRDIWSIQSLTWNYLQFASRNGKELKYILFSPVLIQEFYIFSFYINILLFSCVSTFSTKQHILLLYKYYHKTQKRQRNGESALKENEKKKVKKSSWPFRRNRLQSTFPRQLTRQECPPYNGGICGTAQDLYSQRIK